MEVEDVESLAARAKRFASEQVCQLAYPNRQRFI